MLGGDDDPLGHKVGGVEPDTELPNHGHIGAGGKRLHELLGPRPGDGPEVVDEVRLGHANAAVDDRERVGRLVGDDVDEELGLRIELALVREALEPDLVQGIGGVGDELAEEDLLVGVEGVDDEREQLVDDELIEHHSTCNRRTCVW